MCKLTQQLPILNQRSFWLWLLLSIITLGIGGLIYLYLNLDDLNRLDKYPRPANVPSTKNETVILILLALCLPPIGLFIAMYVKFHKLQRYLAAHPVRGSQQVASGGKVLTIMLFSAFMSVASSLVYRIKMYFFPGPIGPVVYVTTALIGIVGLILAIVLLVYNYHWQEAYNERVRLLTENNTPNDLPLR